MVLKEGVAMEYIITDGKQYISTSGGIRSVNNIKNATKFSKKKADNVLKALPKTLKMFKWECVLVEDEKKNQIEIKSIDEYQGLTDNILEKMIDWENYIIKLQEYMVVINNQLSLVDQEISDIRHYAEDFNLNMYQAWKLYKLLQDACRRRRKIKNEMYKIRYILSSNFVDCTNKAISNYIKNLEHRQYNPRILKELFDA